MWMSKWYNSKLINLGHAGSASRRREPSDFEILEIDESPESQSDRVAVEWKQLKVPEQQLELRRVLLFREADHPETE